jgi:hypothetical protein
MTVGTGDKKKVYALAVLGVIAAYMVYSNVLSGPDIPQSSAPSPAGSPAVAPAPSATRGDGPNISRAPSRNRARSEEFHPSMKSKREDQVARAVDTDPTLLLALLKKVQAVEMAGKVGNRNLFQFSAPPAAIAKANLPAGPEPKVQRIYNRPQQPPPAAPPPAKPPDPPPPPIPLKYYAFWVSRDDGKKTACFLDNEDILMAGEGETVKRRYKVIRINATSVVMEDLDVKKQQTLQLVEEAQGE